VNSDTTSKEKGPKFVPAPTNIPHKNIVAEIKAAIRHLPDDSKDVVRTSSAAVLHRVRLPAHNNVSKEKRKALNNLKKDQSRVVMKADKGNGFVVMERSDYDKMETLLTTDPPMKWFQHLPSADLNAN